MHHGGGGSDGPAGLDLPEAERLAALHSLQILDSETESDYDDLTALAAQICGTPMAAISLVDAQRQWFKSQLGLGIRETAREESFCAHAIQQSGELLVVPDATADERFAANPLVTGQPSIRFYAGAPMVTAEGAALGALCVLDQRPRQLSPAQQAALATLARQVTRLLEQRVAARRLLTATREQQAAEVDRKVAVGRFRRVFTRSASGMLVVAPDGRITESNEAFSAPLGLHHEQLVGRSLAEVTTAEDLLADRELARELLAGTRQQVQREKSFIAADGTLLPALVTSCLIPAVGTGDPEFLEQVEWLTEQRRAERRLLETQSVVDAIVSIDAAGRVISWNEGATRMFGYDREHMLGRPVSVVVPERLSGLHTADIARLAAGDSPRLSGTTDVPALRRDGTEFPVELSLSRWQRGGNRYCTVILRDVTDARRRAALLALTRRAATAANDCTALGEAMSRLLPALVEAGPADAVRAWLAPPATPGSTSAADPARWVLVDQHPPRGTAELGAARAPLSLPEDDDVDSPVLVSEDGGSATLRVRIGLGSPAGAVVAVLELLGPAALGCSRRSASRSRPRGPRWPSG